MADQTRYVVLRLKDNAWTVDGPHQSASSAEQAVRRAAELRAENDLDTAGDYVAVPVRSWNPIRVTPNVVTTLVLEDVTP